VIFSQLLPNRLHPTLAKDDAIVGLDAFLSCVLNHAGQDFLGMIADRAIAVTVLKQHPGFRVMIGCPRRKYVEKGQMGRIVFR
jgi:hypothetical protein